MTDLEYASRFIELRPRMITVTRSYVRDEETASDIVSECFLKVFEDRGQLADVDNLNAYFLKSLRNRCLNWLRAHKIRMDASEQVHRHNMDLLQLNITSLESILEKDLNTTEIRLILDNSLRNMDPFTRRVYEKSRFEDMSYEEIAKELGITTRRVEYEIQKALKTLRGALKDYLLTIAVAILAGIR